VCVETILGNNTLTEVVHMYRRQCVNYVSINNDIIILMISGHDVYVDSTEHWHQCIIAELRLPLSSMTSHRRLVLQVAQLW